MVYLLKSIQFCIFCLYLSCFVSNSICLAFELPRYQFHSASLLPISSLNQYQMSAEHEYMGFQVTLHTVNCLMMLFFCVKENPEGAFLPFKPSIQLHYCIELTNLLISNTYMSPWLTKTGFEPNRSKNQQSSSVQQNCSLQLPLNIRCVNSLTFKLFFCSTQKNSGDEHDDSTQGVHLFVLFWQIWCDIRIL